MSNLTDTSMSTGLKVLFAVAIILGVIAEGPRLLTGNYGETTTVKKEVKAQKSLLVRGYPIRSEELNMIILAFKEMPENTKKDLLNLSPDDKINKDDWDRFREVLEKPSLLIQIEYFSALTRLLETTKNKFIAEALKELICKYAGKFCLHLQATEVSWADIKLAEVKLNTREVNAIYETYKHYNRDLEMSTEDIRNLTVREVANYIIGIGGKEGMRAIRGVGPTTWRDIVRKIGEKDGVTAGQLDPEWREFY